MGEAVQQPSNTHLFVADGAHPCLPPHASDVASPALAPSHTHSLPPPLQVPPERALSDPPLLRLEAEASQAYLSVLLHVQAAAPEAVRAACALEARLTQLCLRNLERFEQQAEAAEEEAARSEGVRLCVCCEEGAEDVPVAGQPDGCQQLSSRDAAVCASIFASISVPSPPPHTSLPPPPAAPHRPRRGTRGPRCAQRGEPHAGAACCGHAARAAGLQP